MHIVTKKQILVMERNGVHGDRDSGTKPFGVEGFRYPHDPPADACNTSSCNTCNTSSVLRKAHA